MYYRHNLNYCYPERANAHIIDAKHLWDVVQDEKYSYLQNSLWFRCQRAFLNICQYTLLPLVMGVRHGLRIHGKEKLKTHRELFRDGLATIANHVFMWDYICIKTPDFTTKSGVFLSKKTPAFSRGSKKVIPIHKRNPP